VQDTSGPNVKASIIGASGYTGAELLRLLLFHPFIKATLITSRQYAGQPLTAVFPHFSNSKHENLIFYDLNLEEVASTDLVFCCLPHKTSFPIIKKLLEINPKIKIIDFSADFRFKNPTSYEQTYNVTHTAKELFSKSAYGLPELFRNEIKQSNLIANPGCYPTSVILALYPAKKENLVNENFPVIADSKSGVTGAGRKATVDFNFCEVNETFKAYAVEGHRHGPEIEEKLNLKVRFTPHLVPMNRGILSTVYFKTDATKEELIQIYKETYKNEPFIRIRKNPPTTSDVKGTNFCDIYITKDEKTGLGIAISAIDNIGKGASGQAIQNANILLNIPETTGLEQISWWI